MESHSKPIIGHSLWQVHKPPTQMSSKCTPCPQGLLSPSGETVLVPVLQLNGFYYPVLKSMSSIHTSLYLAHSEDKLDFRFCIPRRGLGTHARLNKDVLQRCLWPDPGKSVSMLPHVVKRDFVDVIKGLEMGRELWINLVGPMEECKSL